MDTLNLNKVHQAMASPMTTVEVANIAGTLTEDVMTPIEAVEGTMEDVNKMKSKPILRAAVMDHHT